LQSVWRILAIHQKPADQGQPIWPGLLVCNRRIGFDYFRVMTKKLAPRHLAEKAASRNDSVRHVSGAIVHGWSFF
jgi:hypothetical protein